MQSQAAFTHDGLKGALIAEFDHELMPTDAERILRSRKWNRKEESMHFFVLHIKKLAGRMERAMLSDPQLVDVIIENLGLTTENENRLHGAQTIDELKARMVR